MDPVENKTSRRNLVTGGLALATVGVFGASSRLFGHTKESSMQTQPTTTERNLRSVDRVLTSPGEHWVGDGFRVHGVLSPNGNPRMQSPFLLLDHASQRRFEPTVRQRGVGEHPHRGFETVTFAYKGEIAHRDSAGGGGLIGPGDVQWMTAASGVVHEELHSKRFTEQGGDMEMVQLWVNLPAKDKMSTPGYQPLLDKDFPRLSVGAAEARVIAGSLLDHKGPAYTHTPITIFDLRFDRDGVAEFELPKGYTSLLFGLEGQIQVGADAKPTPPGAVAFLSRDEGIVRVRGQENTRLLVLSGEPIDEPVASYGPFVMNTKQELEQAFVDYQSGKMGHLGG
jgi:redox-sensitive bicupin YhaK (pirin superfamily)